MPKCFLWTMGFWGLTALGVTSDGLIRHHHFYLGQSFSYPITFTPKEIIYHPTAGVDMRWHEGTQTVRFVTKKIGMFGVQILHPSGTWIALHVTVYPVHLKNAAYVLEHLVMRGNDIQGTWISDKKHSTISLSGMVYDPRDWVRLSQLLEAHPNDITSSVSLFQPAKQPLVHTLVNHVHEKFGLRLSLTFQGENAVLSGEIPSHTNAETILHYAKRFFPNISLSPQIKTTIPSYDQIQLALEFIEIKGRDFQILGTEHNLGAIAWNEGLPNLQSLIHALVGTGKAKILSTPNIVAKFHTPARLHIGGEIPYEIKSRHRFNVEWKKYGIVMTITPTPVDTLTVHLNFDLSVSFPLGTPTADAQLPAFNTRSLQSQATVPLGQTTVLSGMLQQLEQHATTGIPLLGNIPILGHLFQTRTADTEETELVIAITPKTYVAEDFRLPRHMRQTIGAP